MNERNNIHLGLEREDFRSCAGSKLGGVSEWLHDTGILETIRR
jgi:hypothetical protein